jgi:hypothetical protein
MKAPHHALLGAIATAVCLAFFPAQAVTQAIEEVFTRDKPIPRGYKSWTLFLVCSHEWILPQNKERVRDLYDQFRAFGRTIGTENAAVWFWIRPPNWATDSVTDNVDVERAVTYCRRFSLPLNGGPYVFGTGIYPDDAFETAPRFTLALGSKSPAEITGLLGGFAQDLAAHGVASAPPDTERFWRSLQTSFEALQARVGVLLDRVTFSLNTPWFKVEVKG